MMAGDLLFIKDELGAWTSDPDIIREFYGRASNPDFRSFAIKLARNFLSYSPEDF
jgi:hypothetical protein